MSEIPSPEALRAYYTRFLLPGRVLLTGHSHQAWPDVAAHAMLDAFDDAAAHVDDKWSRAFDAADAVRQAIASRIAATPSQIALAGNTHELVARFLSAIPDGRRRHLVTSGGEFYSIRRQLRRLREEGVAVDVVDPSPVETLAERLAACVRDDTGAVLVSSVLFETSTVVPNLPQLASVCAARDVLLLVDAYHAYNVVPLSAEALGDGVFVVGGGYKYAQYGEGVCFMRVPDGCALRPVYTGWFADFAHLAAPDVGAVTYASDGASRFAGSTYDPVSHYRARAVARFFDHHGMNVEALRQRSLAQTARLLDALDAAGLAVRTPRAPDARGGFVAVRVPDASAACEALRARGIYVDSRGDTVRLGPAPYTLDDELDAGVAALAAFVRG